MGIGVSIFLIAIGAILKYGVDANAVNGINLATIGLILMVVGAIGLIWSLIALAVTSGRRTRGDTIIERRID